MTTLSLRPEPRVRLGLLLSRNRAAAACMDLSDGLADAVHQMADASGVGAAIDAAALPIDPAARALVRGARPGRRRRSADRRRRLRAAVHGPSAGAPPLRGGRAARRRAADAHRTLHRRPRRHAAARLERRAPAAAGIQPLSMIHLTRRARPPLAGRAAAHRGHAASGRRRRSRSASSSASRRSSGCTRCSASSSRSC